MFYILPTTIKTLKPIRETLPLKDTSVRVLRDNNNSPLLKTVDRFKKYKCIRWLWFKLWCK